MEFKYPHTIENCIGEKLIFHEVQSTPEGDKVIVENFVAPGCGPLMHTHFRQDESLTVVSGKLGYQVLGCEPQYASAGETVEFKRGIPHRFWNDGDEVLNCRGWIQPANTIVFFLTSLYAAINKSGNARPETFDGAYLITRYAAEYDIPDMPVFVKRVIMPLTYHTGRFLGKYKHFKNAPAPVK